MDNSMLLNFWKTVSIGFVVLMVLILSSCESSTSSPEIPKIGKAILSNPEGERVPIGATKEDLDQWVEVVKGVTPSLFKEDGEEKFMAAGRELQDMYMSERVFLLPSGMKCDVLEAEPKYCKVQILEGPEQIYAKIFWVFSSCVVN